MHANFAMTSATPLTFFPIAAPAILVLSADPHEPPRTALPVESPEDVLVFDMTQETAFHRRLDVACPLAERILTAPVWMSVKLVLGDVVLNHVLRTAEPFVAPSRKQLTATYYVITGSSPDPEYSVVRGLEIIFGKDGGIKPIKKTCDSRMLTVWSDLEPSYPFLVCTAAQSGVRAAMARGCLQFAYDGKLLYATRSALASMTSATTQAPMVIALPLTWFQVVEGGIVAFVDAAHAEPLDAVLGQTDAISISFNDYGAAVQVRLPPSDQERAVLASETYRRIALVFTPVEAGGHLALAVQDTRDMDHAVPVWTGPTTLWDGAVGKEMIAVMPTTWCIHAEDAEVVLGLGADCADRLRFVRNVRGFAFAHGGDGAPTSHVRLHDLSMEDVERTRASRLANGRIELVFTRRVLCGAVTVKVAEPAFWHGGQGAVAISLYPCWAVPEPRCWTSPGVSRLAVMLNFQQLSKLVTVAPWAAPHDTSGPVLFNLETRDILNAVAAFAAKGCIPLVFTRVVSGGPCLVTVPDQTACAEDTHFWTALSGEKTVIVHVLLGNFEEVQRTLTLDLDAHEAVKLRGALDLDGVDLTFEFFYPVVRVVLKLTAASYSVCTRVDVAITFSKKAGAPLEITAE